MFLVLAVLEVPVLESAIYVCVCVYYCSTYDKAVRVRGVCVCVFQLFYTRSESLLLDRCCCSTGVRGGALGSESTM
jgi:hypothetical protein